MEEDWKEELKNQFSQMEEDLDLPKILKPIPIRKKRTPKKKVVMKKNEDEKSEKAQKNFGCMKKYYTSLL
jgi:hypothetical protein